MTNRFNKHDFIENQAKLDFFDNLVDMLERSLKLPIIVIDFPTEQPSPIKFSSPNVLPILEPEYVVARIVEAVLTNQPELYLPRFSYLVAAIRGYNLLI
jgi:hypothetical protein